MEKITIILLHYNQKQYIYEAINSILKQDYENIELIINDDCSEEFDVKKIEKYIIKNGHGNIELRFNINRENIGIVRSINKCVKMATGKYLTFFAADDALNNEKVISNYVNCFKNNSEIDIWCLQCLMYDINLERVYYKFINSTIKKMVNNWSKKKSFSLICEGCCFAVGATVFKTKTLLDTPFNESYSVVEDWPYYISMIRKGYKVGYHDFVALNHRDGGISHNVNTSLRKKYIDDIIRIYHNEIFPYFNKIRFTSKMRILNAYDITIRGCDYEIEKYNSNGNFSYRYSRFILHIIKFINNMIYNTNFMMNYLYIFVPCILIYILYDYSAPLKVFFWGLSIPIMTVRFIGIFFHKLKKLIFKDDKSERK